MEILKRKKELLFDVDFLKKQLYNTFYEDTQSRGWRVIILDMRR